MDPITSTISNALHTLGLDQWLPAILALHMLASTLDAAIPQPAPGSHWLPLRKLVSYAAGNVKNAANASQPSLVSWLQRVVVMLAAVVPEPVQAAAIPDAASTAAALNSPAMAPAASSAPVTTPIPVLSINEKH